MSTMDFEEYLSSNNGGATDADTDVASILDQFNREQDEAERTPAEPEPTPPVVEEPQPEPAPIAEPKPQQEPSEVDRQAEQNAINAERRRQREAAIAQKAIENSPEVQLAKQIAEMSGKTIDQLQADIRNARIARELQQQGMSDEEIQAALPVVQAERQRAEQATQQVQQLQQENIQSQFQQWVQRIEAEKAQVLASHSYLSQADIDQAQDYMLNTLKQPHVPFEQVIYAVHGAKIFEAQKAAMRTEMLAEMSGRKASPLPPQGVQTDSTPILTADEKFVAKMMGISEQDYIKWK